AIADAVVREPGRRPAARAEIEPAVFLAGVAHLRSAIPLGERDKAAARRHERPDIAVHAPGGRRAKRARGIALRRLGRPRVIDRLVPDILRLRLAVIAPLLESATGD